MNATIEIDIREIVFDTETTGFDPYAGDRITEIGAIELINGLPSGKRYQQYINPECEVSEGSISITGLTNDFLKDFPVFSEIVAEFLEFVGNDTLVAHNASFDMKFINHHIQELGFPILKNKVIDTLDMARKQFPGSPATLDALCKRFNVNIERELHGALLDSEILAEVLIELRGGRQQGFNLQELEKNAQQTLDETLHLSTKDHKKRSFNLSPHELKLHETMLGKIKTPLWKRQ